MEQPLTRMQLELVVLLANGYRIEEIARETHRSTSGVSQILTTARKATGARTLPHLVSIVIASGVLEWTTDGDRKLEPTSA